MRFFTLHHINSVCIDYEDATHKEVFADIIFNSLFADTILSPQSQEILVAGDRVDLA